nr:hypothetical protein [Mycoplasmopsis bovis]
MNAKEKEVQTSLNYQEKDLKQDFNDDELPIGLSFYPYKYDEISKLKRMIRSLNYEFNRLSRKSKIPSFKKVQKEYIRSKVESYFINEW